MHIAFQFFYSVFAVDKNHVLYELIIWKLRWDTQELI